MAHGVVLDALLSLPGLVKYFLELIFIENKCLREESSCLDELSLSNVRAMHAQTFLTIAL